MIGLEDMKLRYFWLLFLSSILTGLHLLNVDVRALFQLTSAMFVLVPVVLFMIHIFSLKGLLRLFVKGNINLEDSTKIEKVISFGFLCGTIGSILGFIHIVEALDTAHLGAGLAVMSISFFYGILPAVLLSPLQIKSKNAPTIENYLGIDKKLVGIYSFLIFMTLTSSLAAIFISTKNG